MKTYKLVKDKNPRIILNQAGGGKIADKIVLKTNDYVFDYSGPRINNLNIDNIINHFKYINGVK